jgi:branched-chain amino acid transport system permease protein
MRSVQGAVLGGYILAFIDMGLNFTLPQDLLKFRDAFTFTAVILILLWRPEGLIKGPASGRRV